jgi:hypothetical protein
MRRIWVAGALAVGWAASMGAQGLPLQPPGAAEALASLASEPATHTSFTFDRDMVQAAAGVFGDDRLPIAGLEGITVENYRYREPAFYVPESVHALVAAYRAAGWKHLVEQNRGPKESAEPSKPMTDLWMHFRGSNIDGVTVVVRGRKQMSVIEVAGILKPLDLVHLGGHFGIPKIDPGAVMVPEK